MIVDVEVGHLDGQGVLCGVASVNALRDAGVPVVGYLWPMGVAEGTLTIERVGSALRYQWNSDLEDIA